MDSANIYPFGDMYRLVIVKNFEQSKQAKDNAVLQNYLNSPLNSTVLVFFSPEGANYFKSFKGLTSICCDKIEENWIAGYIKNQLAKNEILSSNEAISTLIMYCANDMTRVTNELEKLISYVYDTKTLTTETVKQFVTEDKEYQVYELADMIARGKNLDAISLVDSFMMKSGGGMQVFAPLCNNYRRALFVAINKDKTVSELANLLKIKEFAVKMLAKQGEVFSAKKLKSIVDMLTTYDQKIKVGEMKENVAIKTAVYNILNIRGNNG